MHLLHLASFSLFCILAHGLEFILVTDNAGPPKVQTPLNTETINSLPPYLFVRVATVHFDFNEPASNDVPEVDIELQAMTRIFRDEYNFDVRDIAIPRTADAQVSLAEDIIDLYTGLPGQDTLVIIIYGGHGSSGGKWTA